MDVAAPSAQDLRGEFIALQHVDGRRLDERLPEARRAYAAADPFPHVVLDGLLRPEVARELEARFPEPDHGVWKHHLHLHSHKLACNRLDVMPPLFQAVLGELNSPPVLAFLEAMTGISGLLPDPTLEGGGLHQIVRGGYLKVHADFNYHPTTRCHRRLNLLVYLNSDWRDEWDGNLELWDREMTRCVRSIAPALNRAVVFGTTDTAYHGHPRPLACPDGRSRRSLALYYYTPDRPAAAGDRPHSTLYQRVPTDSLLAQSVGLVRHALTPGNLPRLVRTALQRLRG